MSNNQKVKFSCPHCKNERDREVLQSINIDLKPEMRAKINDLSCFEWSCPICGRKSLVIDPCLYHDMSNQFMVWLQMDEKLPDEAAFDPLSGYTLRTVETINAFREKIKILELGLDDRAVEIMKLILSMQIARSMDLVELLYHDFEERTGKFTFVAVLGDGGEQYIQMNGDTYAKIAFDVNERLFTSNKNFAKIDFDWATEALEMLKDG